MPALSTSEKKNQFHSPICGSIGTMGLRTSICAPCDIPNSFTITSAVLRNAFLGTANQDVLFQQVIPDPKLYVYSVLYDSDVMSVTNVLVNAL